MQITEISGFNIHARTFTYPMAPVQMIVGPSRSGKSAVLAAIRLALFGYDPLLGKENGKSFKHAGGASKRMEASIKVAPGNSYSWEWTQTSKGVTRKAPDDVLSIPVVLLDSREFFNLKTPEARKKFVFDSYRFEEKNTGQEMLAQIRGLVDPRSALLKDLKNPDLAESFQDWLARRITEFTELLKTAKAETDRMAKTVAGNAQLTEGVVLPSVEAFAPLINELTEKQKALGTERSSLVTEQQLAEAPALRRGILEKELAGEPDLLPEMARIETQIKAKRAETESHQSHVAVIEAEMARINALAEGLKNVMALAQTEIDSLDQSIALLSQGSCPACTQVIDHEHSYAAITVLSAKVLEYNRSLGSAEGQLNLRRADYREQSKLLISAKSLDQMHRQLAKDIPALEQNLKGLREHHAKTDRLKAELAGLNTSAPAVNHSARIMEIDQELVVIETQLVTARGERDNAVAKHQDLVRSKEAVSAMEKGQAHVATLKAILEVMQKFQGQIVEKVFGTVMQTAGAIANECLGLKLEYRDGDIGYEENGTWITQDTFSGYEKMLSFAAISVALCPLSPLKIVMIDEMGITEPMNRFKLLRHMTTLVLGGHLHQFIGVDSDAGNYDHFTEVPCLQLTK